MTKRSKSCTLARMTEPGNSERGQPQAPGRQFSYWLAQELWRERRGAGDKHGIGIREGEEIPRSTLTTLLNTSDVTIKRREEGQVENGVRKFTFGEDIDKIVAAYAYVLGLDDPRILWERALLLWIAEGALPDYTTEFPGAPFVTPLSPQTGGPPLRAIRDEARRQMQSRGGRKGKPSANPRKREAG